MQGKHILITGHRQVRLEAFDVAENHLGPSEVLLRTRVTLLSGGTEGAWFLGLPIPGRSPLSYPHATGYANIGEIIAVGGSDLGLAVGDVVFTMSAHASHVRLDATRAVCIKVPPELPDDAAVFARLVTVPLTSVRTSTARVGDRAAVVGLGLVGNLGGQVLMASGFETTGVDLIAARREVARRCGIAQTIDPRETARLLPEHRLVLEASGTAKGAVTAITLAQLGGEVSLVGTPWTPDPSVSSRDILEPVHVRYITLRSGWEWRFPIADQRAQPGSVHQPGSVTHNIEAAFGLLRHGKIKVRELITHHAVPEDCERMYEGAVDHKHDQLGVIFHWV